MNLEFTSTLTPALSPRRGCATISGVEVEACAASFRETDADKAIPSVNTLYGTPSPGGEGGLAVPSSRINQLMSMFEPPHVGCYRFKF